MLYEMTTVLNNYDTLALEYVASSCLLFHSVGIHIRYQVVPCRKLSGEQLQMIQAREASQLYNAIIACIVRVVRETLLASVPQS